MQGGSIYPKPGGSITRNRALGVRTPISNVARLWTGNETVKAQERSRAILRNVVIGKLPDGVHATNNLWIERYLKHPREHRGVHFGIGSHGESLRVLPAASGRRPSLDPIGRAPFVHGRLAGVTGGPSRCYRATADISSTPSNSRGRGERGKVVIKGNRILSPSKALSIISNTHELPKLTPENPQVCLKQGAGR